MNTEKQLIEKIEQLKSKIEKLELIANSPMQTPGPFLTGRSNYTMGKALDRENSKKASAFKQLQQAQKDLKYNQNILVGYQNGECHLNGQPKIDAPSKTKKKLAEKTISDFMRARISKGDCLAVAMNPANKICVKRVNKNSITSETGSKWGYSEILLLDNGEPMSTDVFVKEFKKWLSLDNN